MGYLKSATHERKLKGANTILVGPGLTYETTDEGVTAAVAAGASTVSPWTIIDTNAGAVTYDHSAAIRVIAQRDVYGNTQDKVNIDADAAIILTIDNPKNTSAWWTTANAVLGVDPLVGGATNSTPEEYLYRRGIVLVPYVSSDQRTAADGTQTTWPNWTTFNRWNQRAWEIGCHSKSHGLKPTAAADITAEVVTARDDLKAMLDSMVSAHANNVCNEQDDVVCWATPGTWGIRYYLTANRDSLSALIDRSFLAARDYSSTDHSYVLEPGWSDVSTGFYPKGAGPTGGENPSGASDDAYLAAMGVVPKGMFAIALFHQPTDAAATSETYYEIQTLQFKKMVDAIYAAMQAGKLATITMSTALRARLTGRPIGIQADSPGVKLRLQILTSVTEVTDGTANTLNVIDPASKFAFAANGKIQRYYELVPGRRYQLTFDVMAPKTGTKSTAVTVERFHSWADLSLVSSNNLAAAYPQGKIANTWVIPDAWERRRFTFLNPKYCENVKFNLFVANNNDGAQICNIALTEV